MICPASMGGVSTVIVPCAAVDATGSATGRHHSSLARLLAKYARNMHANSEPWPNNLSQSIWRPTGIGTSGRPIPFLTFGLVPVAVLIIMPTSSERMWLTGKPAIEPSTSTQSLPSQRLAKPLPPFGCCIFLCRRDYIITLSGLGASSRLALLPRGIVVTPFRFRELGSGLSGLDFPRIHPVLRSRLLGKAPNFFRAA